MVVQFGEQQCFLQETLEALPLIVKDLQPGQIHVFYQVRNPTQKPTTNRKPLTTTHRH